MEKNVWLTLKIQKVTDNRQPTLHWKPFGEVICPQSIKRKLYWLSSNSRLWEDIYKSGNETGRYKFPRAKPGAHLVGWSYSCKKRYIRYNSIQSNHTLFYLVWFETYQVKIQRESKLIFCTYSFQEWSSPQTLATESVKSVRNIPRRRSVNVQQI